MLRFVFPLVIGLGGAGVLASLGAWQLQRLEWKQGVLAEIEAQISGTPVALPADPTPEADRYLPVRITGESGTQELHVLVSQKHLGAGFRIVTSFETTTGRAVLLDHGFVLAAAKDADRPPRPMTVTGNLHWPDDRDRFTPQNDPTANYWYARDIDQMAQALDTEPLLVIVAETAPSDPAIEPLPVSTAGIPNSHLGYAIQWFGLAAVWLGMTGFFTWRLIRRRA